MRRGLLALAGVMLVAACGADPGVRTERADTHPIPASIDPAPTTVPDNDNDNDNDNGNENDGNTTHGNGDGVGDELFPDLGNPAVDVTHYDIDLTYDPVDDTIDGTVGLDTTFTADREAITLDAIGLDIAGVTVDGEAADARLDGPELRIALPTPKQAGDEVRIEIAYRVGTADRSSSIGLPNGWFDTPGGSYVLNEPDGARTWMPCNDHPSDKATYTFTITVPNGLTAVANGALTAQRTNGGTTTWEWQEDDPMATYLIQLLTGDYELVEGSGPDGLPLVSAILRDDLDIAQPFLEVTPTMIDYFDGKFGPYPLDRYGIAIVDSFGGLAMETQGRSLFSRLDFVDGELGYGQQMLLSHELAHQWFGDAVSPARWQDIWLNESFATYGAWMWMDHVGLSDLDDDAASALANGPGGSPAEPTVQELFSWNSYEGGAVVLHALRLTIGDAEFFELLQRWVAENNGSSRTTDDFVELADTVAGEQLTEFFDTWLFADDRPAMFPPS